MPGSLQSLEKLHWQGKVLLDQNHHKVLAILWREIIEDFVSQQQFGHCKEFGKKTIEHCHSEYCSEDITLLHIIVSNGDAGNLKLVKKILHGKGQSKK